MVFSTKVPAFASIGVIPISTPDMVFSIYNAATRITRDGQAIGRGSADGSSDSDARITDWQNKKYDTRDERISAYEALKCNNIHGPQRRKY